MAQGIGHTMAQAWHNHPYLIMGAGGLIVLYFLWPSKEAPAAAPSRDDYATQLAAQTALSQTQLAEQAQTNQMQVQAWAAENAAVAQATAASNSAIAQSNAAAIISYNQTAQAYIQGGTALGIANTEAESSNFQALLAGLLGFSQTSLSGINDATNMGVNAYLAGLGANFSSTENGNSFSSSATWDSNAQQGTVSTVGLGNAPPGSAWYYGGTSTGSGTTNLADPALVGTFIGNTTGPFAANENLLLGLWQSAIHSFDVMSIRPVNPLPLPPGTNTQGQLVGQIQPVAPPVIPR
jgi:hypothetical protein